DNSGFTGPLNIYGGNGAKTGGTANWGFDNSGREGRVYITSEANLGGDPGAFNAAQLHINNAVLDIGGNPTVICANRGITIGAANAMFDISDGAVIESPISGAGTLNKKGAGALILNGANTIPLTVSAGAIGGRGSVAGKVTLPASGAEIKLAGNGYGIFELSNSGGIALNNATLSFDLRGASSGISDRLVIGGALALDGDNTVFINTPEGDLPAGIYTLATYASKSGPDFVLGQHVVGATLVTGANALTLEVVDDSTAVFTLSPNAIKWNGADVIGYLNTNVLLTTPVLPQNLQLYYGSSDGGEIPSAWDGDDSPVEFSVDAQDLDNCYFTGTIPSGLKPVKTYFARFAITNELTGDVEWSPNSTEFITVSPVQTTGASGMNWESATIAGTLAADAGVYTNALLFYGTTDGTNNPTAWNGGAPYEFVFTNTTALAGTLSNLAVSASYFARYAMIDDESGELVWSPVSVSFATTAYPVPAFNAPAFVFSPNITNANITVTTAGINSVLVFAYDDEEKGSNPALWANVISVAAPTNGVYAFTLENTVYQQAYAWRAFLIPELGETTERFGTFKVNYTYTWIGPSGTAVHNWNTPAYWDVGTVPNHPGAYVIFPNNALRNVNIAGAEGGSITVGTIVINGVTWEDWNYYTISSSDGTTLIFDNSDDPARIEWRSNTAPRHYTINAPMVFAGETHVYTSGQPLHLLGPSFSGDGPLVKLNGQMGIGSSGGVTNEVTVPITSQVSNGTNPVTFPSGAIHLVDHNRNLPLAYHWNGFIFGGVRLIVDGCALSDNGDNSEPYIFTGNNAEFLVTNRGAFTQSRAFITFSYGSTGGGNNLTVTGDGSTLTLPRTFVNGLNNRFNIRDGARVSIANNGNPAVHFNAFDNRYRGNGNKIILSSERPGEPSVLNVNNGNINFNATACAINVLPGGVLTNAATITVGVGNNAAGVPVSENSIDLEGGKIYCNNFVVSTNNFLKVVLNSDREILPVEVQTEARFALGANIIPENPDGVTGTFPLVTAPLIILPDPENPNSLLADLPDKMVWRLYVKPNAGENTKTLNISCHKPGTVVIIR
ncbi:MAG: hypothetical protein FWG05_03925, partial [Kiritimatiellaeota bacterium]|nr:hypothetical protein [Kiritimatiellota bacterium]